MTIEKQSVSEAEMLQKAEESMSPEQKLMSDAHEEGYNLAASKKEKVVYVGVQHPEKKELATVQERKWTLTFAYTSNEALKSVVDFAKSEAEKNNITFQLLSGVRSLLNSEVKIRAKGSKKDLERFGDTMKNFVKTINLHF